MPKFKKFASKLFDRAIEGLEAISAAAAESAKQQKVAATQTQAAPAPTVTKSPMVEVNPEDWSSHCTHISGICSTCLAAVKTCIQHAIDSGVPGGFNFATGQLDRDVAECNNSCPHKGINDCCAICMMKFMGQKEREVNNLISVSSAAVGHLNNAALGVGSVGSGLGTLRQNIHQRSIQTEAQRAAYTQQRLTMPSPIVLGGYGGGGGTWGRQQQIANGMVWDPPVYATNTAYNQFRW